MNCRKANIHILLLVCASFFRSVYKSKHCKRRWWRWFLSTLFSIWRWLIGELTLPLCSLAAEPALRILLFMLHKYLHPLYLTETDRREEGWNKGKSRSGNEEAKGVKTSPARLRSISDSFYVHNISCSQTSHNPTASQPSIHHKAQEQRGRSERFWGNRVGRNCRGFSAQKQRG